MGRPNHGALGLSFLACRALQFVCLVVVMGMTARFIATMVDDIQQPPPPIIAALTITCFAILYVVITVILYVDKQLPFLAIAGLDGIFFIALMIVSIVIGKPLSYLSCKALGSEVKPMEIVNNLESSLNQVPTPTPTAVAAFTAAAVPTPANLNAVPEAVQAATSTAIEYLTTTAANTAATVAATLAPGGTREVWGSDGQMYTITGPGRLARRGDTTNALMKAINYDEWVAGGTENSCMMMKAVWGFGICLTIMFVFSAAMMVFVWKMERTPRAKKIEEDS